jgi:hypothetical protein
MPVVAPYDNQLCARNPGSLPQPSSLKIVRSQERRFPLLRQLRPDRLSPHIAGRSGPLLGVLNLTARDLGFLSSYHEEVRKERRSSLGSSAPRPMVRHPSAGAPFRKGTACRHVGPSFHRFSPRPVLSMPEQVGGTFSTRAMSTRCSRERWSVPIHSTASPPTMP